MQEGGLAQGLIYDASRNGYFSFYRWRESSIGIMTLSLIIATGNETDLNKEDVDG